MKDGKKAYNIFKILMAVLLVAILVGCGKTIIDEKKKDDTTVSTSETPTEKETSSTKASSTSTSATEKKSESTSETDTSSTKESESKTEKTSKTGESTTAKAKQEKTDGVTYVKGVLIANKTYGLPASYAPGCDPEADDAYYEMKAAAKEDGVSLFVVSDFRSYETQESIYNRYVNEDGKAAADRYSARPGHSEHQTGLAYDLNSLSTDFGETTEGKWLAQNCWKYGFIIRYPQGKENITGYMYEPWHVRYLGKDTAKAVYESGLTLEEYLGIDSKYGD